MFKGQSSVRFISFKVEVYDPLVLLRLIDLFLIIKPHYLNKWFGQQPFLLYKIHVLLIVNFHKRMNVKVILMIFVTDILISDLFHHNLAGQHSACFEIWLLLQYFIKGKMEKSYKFKYASSKKALEAISRFNYYLEQIIPTHFANRVNQAKNSSETLEYATGTNNLIYLWATGRSDDGLLVTQESILHAIKATHLTKNRDDDQIYKINEKSYQKMTKLSSSMLAGEWTVMEIVEFVVKPGENKAGRKFPFQLHIIHHCQTEHSDNPGKFLKWLQFVEKYEFAEDATHYEAVAVANLQKAIFGLYSNVNTLQKFLRSYMKLESLQGQLLKYQDNIKQQLKQSEDPAFSEDQKLSNLIPSQFLKVLHILKKQFGVEHEQLICRYMIAREFKLEECRTDIKQYLRWYKEMDTKYKWEDFDEFHKMNIFYELGEDYKGRPVILNMAKNVLIHEIDAEKYCLYYLYFLEIHMPKKMRGNVYQVNIIADVQGIGQKNFKFAVTKRNVEDGKKYCVERQFKFFAVNVGSFAYFCYNFIKPLLPKKTSQKVFIGGNDHKEITQNLAKDMSMDVIPRYLGGKNPLI